MAGGVEIDAAAIGGSMVVGMIADRVIAATLARMAVSGGVIGIGAGSSWTTFGVGFAVALGVDWIIGKMTDPESRITADICRRLDELKYVLCEGDGKAKGLHGEFTALGRSRGALQHEAIRQMIFANR